jgi:uncharacterized protein YkwD
MKISYQCLFFFSFFLCCLFSCTSEQSTTPIESPSPTMDYVFNSDELETMALINKYRQDIGLSILEQNKHVSYVCEKHNTYMITNNIVSHDGFEQRYNNIVQTLGAIKVGENIAYNYKSPKGALDAWLLSPGHKKIIEGDYTHFGISITQSKDNKSYYTNIFIKLPNK